MLWPLALTPRHPPATLPVKMARYVPGRTLERVSGTLNCIAVCSFQIPNRNCNADERLQYAKGRATCGLPWSMTTPKFRKSSSPTS